MTHTRLAAWLLRPTPPAKWLGVVVGAAFIAAETLLLVPLGHVAHDEALVVVYMLGVLTVSVVWGWWLGAAMAVASALAFNYFHVEPIGHIGPEDTRDWVQLIVFLIVALLASSLAGLARARAAEAIQQRREAESAARLASVLATEQAALRRVATLVARGGSPAEVFNAVAGEANRLLRADATRLLRVEAYGSATVVAESSEPSGNTLLGKRVVIDCQGVPDPLTALARELGVRSVVAASITVEGTMWGALVACWSQNGPPADDAERRMAQFTELIATAIANADSRAQLTASRARIVVASDEARRRIERDLHDGTQQRLVTLGLELRAAEASVPQDQAELRGRLSRTAQALAGVFEDLQEVTRGIHPAVLSQGGLMPALRTLARRAPIPVELTLGANHRFPDCVEVAAYYVASEAMTNAIKHANASVVSIDVQVDDQSLVLAIRDDGLGGADPASGSGLTGLQDRVEAIGGQMQLVSPVGGGTTLTVRLPVVTDCRGLS